MSLPFPSLTLELTIRIVAALLLGTGRILDLRYDDPRSLASDVELAYDTLVYLVNFTLTFRTLWGICAQSPLEICINGVGAMKLVTRRWRMDPPGSVEGK